MEFISCLNRLINREPLNQEEAFIMMKRILDGELSSEQIAGFLVALRIKGETIDELIGFIRAMRSAAIHLPTTLEAVDTCGTGGDHSATFNISTAAAIVAAAAGVPIAKHGNRSVSSQCGSADVLEELGVTIQIPPDWVRKSLEELGIAFCFAPLFHGSMKYAVKPRKELGIRTVFNMLGPLLNPFNTRRQLTGVYNRHIQEQYRAIFQKIGCEHVLIIHSADGMDEFSLSSENYVVEITENSSREHVWTHNDMSLPPISAESIKGGNRQVNARMILEILQGINGPPRHIVVANAALAIYCGAIGNKPDLKEARERAESAIDSGAALDLLNRFITFTGSASHESA